MASPRLAGTRKSPPGGAGPEKEKPADGQNLPARHRTTKGMDSMTSRETVTFDEATYGAELEQVGGIQQSPGF
ncbi:hypothetical protein [Verminephrobacter eiseniae]|uniref:hypothetical protein n=1 Tax=Verminephrobacter eiseniae TaxID=364317 RepID=UPI002237B689|nr:hypothetical protein [Verminephrobacter eiseniae]